MRNQLTIFDLHDNDVRVVTVNGEPWFMAADVVQLLGFTSTASAGYHLRHLAKDETRFFKFSEIAKDSNITHKANITVAQVCFPNRGANCVSESGLYKLIMRSEKPEARDFQNWVTRVVLPAIRKDGGYITGEEKVTTAEMSEDEFIAKAYEMLQRKVERLGKENTAKNEELTSVGLHSRVS